MFNGVCLSEIAMEKKIMWERHISKLCLKFLKIQTIPGFLRLFKSFQRQKSLMLGLFEFQEKKVPAVFLTITVCQQRNHQEIIEIVLPAVVAKITRESTNYAALVLLKNKTHLNLLWIDKTLPKWKIHLAIKFEECLESVQNEILANVFRCHCNFNDID